MEEKKPSLAERLADMPQEPKELDLFKQYYHEFNELYGTEEPDYKSEKYCQFVIAMQLIRLNNGLKAIDYNYRSINGKLNEEELANIEKWKKFNAS